MTSYRNGSVLSLKLVACQVSCNKVTDSCQARVVRDGEEPYKMVASMWINMKLKQDMSTLSMPLFGLWQTDPFVPPVAENGKVSAFLGEVFVFPNNYFDYCATIRFFKITDLNI